MSKPKLVVIGNGMAGARVLEDLFELAPDMYDVTMFGAEPRPNYNRIMLSPVLAGESTFDDIVINDLDWYRDHDVDLKLGVAVSGIDRGAKIVRGADGEETPYDKLVLATGSDPFIIPVPGHDLPGVITFRDLDDVDQMLTACKSGGRAVVIGGGLLGLEAAHGLSKNGMDVTIIHLMDTLMERQLDQPAGYLLEKELSNRGMQVLTKANTEEIFGDDKVEGVRLKDGREIPAEIVVMAVGIRPNSALAKTAGLDVERGVLVDDSMTTSDADILSVGECIQHRGACYGLVAPIWDMCRAAAGKLADAEGPMFEGAEVSTKLKVSGVDVFSAGDFADGEDREEIVFRDAARGVYKRLVLEDDKLIGAVMYGDTADGAYFFQRIKDAEPVEPDERETLIFGQSFAGGAPVDPMAAVAALPDEAEICGCNGVSKGKIVTAIGEKGLTDIDGVRACTKASSSCGTCTGLVEQLLALSLGDAFDANAVKTMCGCTDLGHDEVRRLILAKELKSVPAVMQELNWKTSCGCAKCRPALNYYLLASWPGEYVDDAQSRFINERAHANIQKDGTFSVVPRAWGGMTTSSELRAIADVVDKFEIPTVKYTGGQRIDMLGVKKEDLPAVWADL
ncbi:MAG: nitrite reductase large subunit NirB, partial [Pseudomonadota bacterium]